MMLKEAIIRNYIRIILNENANISMIDFTLGEYTERVPASLMNKIKKVVRELVMLESPADD